MAVATLRAVRSGARAISVPALALAAGDPTDTAILALDLGQKTDWAVLVNALPAEPAWATCTAAARSACGPAHFHSASREFDLEQRKP